MIGNVIATRRRTSLALLQQSGASPNSENAHQDALCKRHSDDPGRGIARVKRTKVGPPKLSQPDSDDFVDDVPRHGLMKITKAKHDKGKYEISDNDTLDKYIDNYVADDVGVGSDMDDEKFPSMNTRSSASIFVKAISDMSDVKKLAIREMGLGCLLELGITSTPSKMGLWLVENFNYMDRKLQLYDGEKVLDKMKECADADDWFKRHFIVLMVSCLFESCPNGMANFRLMHMLEDLSTVANMNWFSYMIRCLVDSKRSWEANDKVVLSVRSVARVFPTFKSWSNESLRDRERDEISSGAFGKGFVDSDMCVNVTSPQSDKALLRC
ncbi:Unknown protein [Striga hermonthica]|uniref:Uncharacterized protein n=1 Tax=Striga hermonthica TaxID=68872 RepID=A0A9N7N420_STRHE|nr:Unknown protein [Striga hermonthica]